MTTGLMANQLLVTSILLLHVILIESTFSHTSDDLIRAKIMKSLCFRHSDKMIEQLEKAGLGYFISATETQHKLGMSRVKDY